MEETGRDRANRIVLDYHKKRDDLWKRRKIAAWLAFGLASLYAIYACSPWGKSNFSTGKLSRAHAQWDVDCQQCHEKFQAVDPHAWLRNTKLINEKCTACHAGTGHHIEALDERHQSEIACSACHREHRGRDGDLTLVANQVCTDCHAKLDTVRKEKTSIDPEITAFTENEHPDFTSWRVSDDTKPSVDNDPGNVRFNHKLHLLPGITAPGLRYQELSLGKLGERYSAADQEQFQKQYRSSPTQPLNEPVQLDCADCHRTADSQGTDNLHEYGNRLFMQPVRYESHCKACHPLDLADLATNGVAQMAPHGMPLLQIRDLLLAAVGTSIDTQIEREIDARIMNLEGRCIKCHDRGTFDVEPHKVSRPPHKWLHHAHFSHDAHTGFNCSICHKPSDPSNLALLMDERKEEYQDQNRVTIEGINVCFQCHSPTSTLPSKGSSDCVECHRYHVDPIDVPLYGKSTRQFSNLLNAK